MISTFGSAYFGNQYQLDTATTVDLGEVNSGSSVTAEFYNASDAAVSEALSLGLEDGTFEVTWEGQSALSTAAQLAANPLEIRGHDSVTVTVTFLGALRDSVQSTTLSWAGAAVLYSFARHILVDEKPQGNVSETLEFKTNVSETWDGTEQRTRLRASPRSIISYEYLVDRSDRATGRKFQAQLMGLTSRRAKLALWHRYQPVTVSVTADARLNLNGPSSWDPALYEVQPGSIVSLEDREGTRYDVSLLQGQTFSGSDQVFLNFADASAIPFGMRDSLKIIPAPVALLAEKPRIEVYPSDVIGYKSRWTHEMSQHETNHLDDSDLYSALAPEQYNGRPLLREGNFIGSSLSFSGESGAVKFDRGIGRIDTFHRRESSVVSFKRTFEYANDSERVDALRNFLLWTQGRQRSFYVPSGTEDLKAISYDTDTETIVVEGTDMGGLAPLLDGYASIEFTQQNGAVHQADIEDAVINSDGTVSLTTGTLTTTSSPIARIEILYHVRMASDKVTVKYEGRDTVECRFDVQTVKQ